MFTPQDIEKVSFDRATFGGYNIEQVDEFLEPLTEYYVTLYKENALLKSKMRVLVTKLEEYRQNEASMKDAIVNAQKTCDKMIRDAEVKAAQLLSNAHNAAAASSKSTDAMIAAENSRVEEARKAAAVKIDELQEQLRICIQALDRIKGANAPAPAPAVDVADEIAQNVEALVGTTVDAEPKAEPKHPVNESTTSRFAKLNLQFGHNYDPTHK